MFSGFVLMSENLYMFIVKIKIADWTVSNLIFIFFILFLAEITPVAITAVVLAILSFIMIVAAICLCCCRSQPEKQEKPYLFREFPAASNRSYVSLPGYNYGSTGYTSRFLQSGYSTTVQPSAPMFSPHGCSHPNVPLVHQKVEIRYERPPPYDA